MKKQFILLIFSVLFFTNALTQTNSSIDKLPFKMTITTYEPAPRPDYFGGGKGNPWTWVDFPVCPVQIDDEYWVFYKGGDGPCVFRWKGTNIEDAVRQSDGNASFPVWRPYILGGIWYDKTAKKLYAPLHCEYFDGASQPHRHIHLASSADKGLTWQYEGPIVTRDDPSEHIRKPSEFSGLLWDGGAGDFQLYPDERSGYVYLYASTYLWMKEGRQDLTGFNRHLVARCAMKDMANTNAWHKFYNGTWDEPGLGGKESYVNAYYITYNTAIKKYIGTNFNSGMAVCDDLEKQNWSSGIKIGNYWGMDFDTYAWHLVDVDKKDIFHCGKTFYLYTYFGSMPDNQAKCYKINIEAGETLAEEGYSPEGMFGNAITTMDPTTFYPLEPIYESCNPIDSRRTRRVDCQHKEMTYQGAWTAEKVVRQVKTSSTPDESVQFAFRGTDVYWRAVKGPDCGKADVYIDGKWQATVDCYASQNTPYQFAFIKKGLTDDNHIIMIVVKGEKCRLSSGNKIRHLLFEYSAENYRSSDCFSNIMGNNNWYYLQNTGGFEKEMQSLTEMRNGMDISVQPWTGDQCATNLGFWRNEISFKKMFAVTGDVIRKWIAPHDGTVRLEGEVEQDGFDIKTPTVLISVNGKKVWSPDPDDDLLNLPYDFTVKVKSGDAIRFVVRSSCEQNPVRVNWDPDVTYIHD
ncbi:MAG: hypothetical protein LBR67_07940 [Dysgonamonadaceae bacterium]|jgi:hypothetical protein|nr:hypothetical protein [Dysgonamonadaceae bacterium]